jgi:hypothetical protein
MSRVGANYEAVMASRSPPPQTAFEGGIINFVFGEMWMRPALDQRTRRWISLPQQPAQAQGSGFPLDCTVGPVSRPATDEAVLASVGASSGLVLMTLSDNLTD